MADNGSYRPCDDARLEVTSICRGVGCVGTIENQNYAETYFAELGECNFGMCNSNSSQCDVVGIVFELLGFGRASTIAVVGEPRKDGAEYMEDAPWMLIFPALFFSATLYALNRVGESLSGRNQK